MKRIIIILVFALLLTFGACNVNTGDTQTPEATEIRPEVSSTPTVLQTSPTSEQTSAQDFSQYIYYSWKNPMEGTPYLNEDGEYSIDWVELDSDKDEGIYRYNLNGTGEELWIKGDNVYCMGIYEGWMYYTQWAEGAKFYEIYKVDITGQQKQKVFDLPRDEVIMVNDMFYYLNDRMIYRIKPGEEAELIAQIPDSIEASVADFIADGEKLYFSTYTDEPEWWDLYYCNTETGEIKPVLKSINDSILVDDGKVYRTGVVNSPTEGYIYRYDIETGENLILYETGCTAYDFVVFNDWLIFMTSRWDEKGHEINGYNLITAETFTLKSPGGNIYEVLPTQINIYTSSFEGLKGRLFFKDGEAVVETFGE